MFGTVRMCVLGLFECVGVFECVCVCVCWDCSNVCVCVCTLCVRVCCEGGGAKMHARGCTMYIPAAVLFSYLSINMEASIKWAPQHVCTLRDFSQTLPLWL